MEEITLFHEQEIEEIRVDENGILDLSGCPKVFEIQNTIQKCYYTLIHHEKVMCSISGGYDSDIVLDLIIRCGGRAKTTFVFNDTGLEYDATKEHLKYLEDRYGIQIKRLSPKKAIPSCCRDYGVPFWSKYVSGMIYRLQKHGFQWEDKPLEVLLDRYPGCPLSA